MHILLTDILTCPVCGPTFGLILRADRMADRRVSAGALGCPNCRRQYPITDGTADLRPPPDAAPGATAERTEGPETVKETPAPEAIRVAALLGLGPAGPGGGGAGSAGFVLLAGPAAAVADEVARVAPESGIVALNEPGAEQPGAAEVSRLVIGAALPFYGAKLHGIWLGGAYATTHLKEAARALHPLARLILEPAPSDAVARLDACGLRVVAQEGDTILAART